MTVAERDEFERAERVFLNGVLVFPGPCPNERLGIIDAIVYGTSINKRSCLTVQDYIDFKKKNVKK